MTNPKPVKLDLSEIDQGHTAITNHLVPHYASVFRAFCREEDVTRAEALALTIGYIQKPLSKTS